MLSINQLTELFEYSRFKFITELDLQNGIELVLKTNDVSYIREFSLNSQDRPDFMLHDGIAIEVKIQGTFAQALRQINRYAKHNAVKSIFLIGSPAWLSKVPSEIGGKPVHSFRITGSLL